MAGMSRISAMFTADTSGLTSGTKQASSALRSLSGDVASLKSSMNALVGINAAQLFGSIASGITSAAKSFASFAGNSSETIDQLSKMAARLGVSYKDMSGLSLAADLAGVSVGTLAGAMTKADRAFIEAQRGSKTATDAFARIGLSLDDLANLDPRGRFDAIADAISALPTAAERSAAAIALFGKSGAELLPLFQSGATGIREAAEQAERLGLNLSNVQGTNVEAMNDSWTLVKKSIEGVIQQVVANLAPAITAINRMWTDFVQSTGGAKVGEYIADSLIAGAEYLASVADMFTESFTAVWDYASQVSISWEAIASTLRDVFFRAGQALTGVFNAAQAGLSTIILGLSEVVIRLANVAKSIGAYLGFDTSSLDRIVNSAKLFNEELRRGIDRDIRERDAAFKNAWNGASEAGKDVAGPFSDAVRRAREAMLAARNAPDTPDAPGAKPKADPVRVEVDTSKLVSALDARTKEGNKEMLRLIYGNKNTVEDQQLAAQQDMVGLLEEVVGNTADDGMEAFAL